MPTYLRRFYIQKASQFYKEEKAAYDKQGKKSSGISRPGISRG
tara:strand:- start:1834 stop:1962 length:129 start_codon:yes stop_codon:yes gene_type:complete